MIMESLGAGRIRQCEQANVAFALTTSCVGEGVLLPASAGDRQWHPEFEKWSFDSDYRLEEPLSWEELTTEINAGRPLAFSWVVSAPVSHLMVLVGYEESGGDRRVIYLAPVYDDEPDVGNVPFSTYDGSDGRHPHKNDYFRIRPKVFP
jgi:hypothetical protein